MPLTSKGEAILEAMKRTYSKKTKKHGKKSPKEIESIFYASQKAGTIKGTHKEKKR